jgi:penicillin amidase
LIRRAAAAVILAALLYAGFRSVGPVPPLGTILDPANGAWASAAAVNFPAVQTRGVAGITQPVRVVFDDRGVPHIFASNELDAYRALGYVVARDRLFQMETQTRAAAGTLTEWAGERLLEADREARGLGLRWSAERKFAAYDTTSAGFRALVAYAQGVNAWIANMRPRDLPIEYRLLKKRPMEWQPIHSLYFMSRMAMTLGLNDATMKRLRAQALVGREAADALFPLNSPIQEPIQPNGLGGPRYEFGPLPQPGRPDSNIASAVKIQQGLLASFIKSGRSDGGTALGSNNWAVSPARSSTGHAILAGDPHLELSLPSIWYEMHLVVPGRMDVAGVGFPGIPGVVIGFNRDVAWTFTNTGSDVHDFYSEEVDNDAAPSRYKLDGGWKDLEKRIEEYRSPDGGVIATDTMYFTHRGPMRRTAGKWVSMRWTAYERSHEPDNFLALATVTGVDQWLDAMHDFVVPTQNGLVADRSGNIAIRSTGMYPVRPGDGRGDVLRDGTLSSSDWRGALPVSQYPFSRNPAQGFLASANQQPVDPAMNPAYMGSDWYSPWRAMHINKLLRSKAKVTPNDMRLFQTDPGSARADAFVPVFLSAAAREDSAGRATPELRKAAALLAEWDRRYVKSNRRAVLFEKAMEELARRTWDELTEKPADTSGVAQYVFPEAQLLLRLTTQPESPWWDDRRTPARETRDAIVASSLVRAHAALVKEKGEAASGDWLWSNNRHANISHLLRIPAFSSPKVPVQGGPSTLNPSSGSGRAGASWRMVVELGPEIRAWAVYPGGQSGAPASPRYRDRLSRWADGMLDPVLFPGRIEDIDRRRVISTLTLNPTGQ